MAIRQWFTFEHVPVARDVSPNQCALAANARRRHHVNALKLCGPVGDADRAVVALCPLAAPHHSSSSPLRGCIHDPQAA
ncbi:MAG: hypothetical protein QOJ15_7240 [Bradyrhizobium sp.]|nr:hypothetical protein [Bradyrhizobium sp.]